MTAAAPSRPRATIFVLPKSRKTAVRCDRTKNHTGPLTADGSLGNYLRQEVPFGLTVGPLQKSAPVTRSIRKAKMTAPQSAPASKGRGAVAIPAAARMQAISLCARHPDWGVYVRDFCRRPDPGLYPPLGLSLPGTRLIVAGASAATSRSNGIKGKSVQFFDGPTLAHVASKSWDACSKAFLALSQPSSPAASSVAEACWTWLQAP